MDLTGTAAGTRAARNAQRADPANPIAAARSLGAQRSPRKSDRVRKPIPSSWGSRGEKEPSPADRRREPVIAGGASAAWRGLRPCGLSAQIWTAITKKLRPTRTRDRRSRAALVRGVSSPTTAVSRTMQPATPHPSSAKEEPSASAPSAEDQVSTGPAAAERNTRAGSALATRTRSRAWLPASKIERPGDRQRWSAPSSGR